MITRRYYLIKFTDNNGSVFWLNKNIRKPVLYWHNHGMNKEYKTFGSAKRMAERVRRGINGGSVDVVEVSFVPTTPELPNGYYKPVEKSIYTIHGA